MNKESMNKIKVIIMLHTRAII